MSFHKTLFLFLLTLSACTQNGASSSITATGSEAGLYSQTGQEHQVHFKALFRTNVARLEDLNTNLLSYRIRDTTEFLFGPLTYHNLGGVQKGEVITPLLTESYVENGRLIVPYTYEATWMLSNSIAGRSSLRLPLPFSISDLKTPGWKNCTDTNGDHGTWDFFWYFWEPSRQGCDHRLNSQYQQIDVSIGAETAQTKVSYPEYSRMIRNKNGTPTLSMTFAFGYVEENENPRPFKDADYGMRQFQSFYQDTKNELLALGFEEKPVRQKDIDGNGSIVIGSQFVGTQQGVRVEVSVVAAAGIDQMDLFAHSYARNHEGFFGWFGHSRVGSGFDAQTFEYKLKSNPRLFSLTNEYQLVYWAGCNSYSYYTLPFFELKSALDPESDPHGTRQLDLISNTLPSLFALNADNANVLFHALLNREQPTSYQNILQQIENIAAGWGTEVIVNVLGDEDNPGI